MKPHLHASSPSAPARWLSSLLILLAAGAVIAPMLVRGPGCGLDFIFHFVSWHDALKSWHHGIPYPHWATDPNFGAGEPRFVFYPPLIWMLGAALGTILPWATVPLALCFVLLAAAGFATRALARLVLPEAPAVLAACTAIFSGYNLYEIYHHGDFALLSGGFWIPALLLVWLRDNSATVPNPTAPASPARRIRIAVLGSHLAPIALLLTGTWLSNTPLGLMATYMLAALGLLAAVQQRSWLPLLRLALGVGLGLGLAAFYLVPAALEQHWVDILKLFATPDHLIQNRFLTSELARPHSHAFPSQRIRGVIELLMLLLALGGLVTLWLRSRKLPASDQPASPAADLALWPANRLYWSAFALIAFGVLFLLLPISLPVWNFVPRLRFLQYPWRWLVVLQAPMAIAFAAALWPRVPRLRSPLTIACATIFLLVTAAAGHSRSFFTSCPASPADPNSIAGIDRALAPGGTGVGGYDEYATPPGARNDLIPVHLPDACLVHDPAQILSNVPAGRLPAFYTPLLWTPELHTCDQALSFTSGHANPEHLHLDAQLASPGTLILRLRSYPAWHITLNGSAVTHTTPRPDGLIAVPSAAGPIHLAVDWRATPDVLLGRILSALSLALLLFLALLRPTEPAARS